MGKNSASRSIITVRARPGWPAQGLLRFGAVTIPCALGRSGITARKREGDGATPLAAMRLCSAVVKSRLGTPVRTRLPLRAVRATDGWCDAVFDRNYNRPVRLPYAAGAERMLRPDRLYDVCIVLDWNVSRRVQGRGSAIFLHVAKPGHAPTEGCVALAPRDMARLLPHLTARTVIRVVR